MMAEVHVVVSVVVVDLIAVKASVDPIVVVTEEVGMKCSRYLQLEMVRMKIRWTQAMSLSSIRIRYSCQWMTTILNNKNNSKKSRLRRHKKQNKE